MTKANARLEERPIEADSPEYEAFSDLYLTAFPEEERIDAAMLLASAQAPACSFVAYFDEGAFCGFTFEIDLDRAHYVVFLAVNDKIRSRGYGTRILSHIRERAAGKPLVLDVEPLDDAAPNARQRERRVRFYERNGFSPTGYQLAVGSVRYAVLSTDGFADMQALKADFCKLVPEFESAEFVRA